MRARFIPLLGVRGKLRIYWEDVVVTCLRPCEECPDGHPDYDYISTCPNAYGSGRPGYHNAYAPLGDKLNVSAEPGLFGREEDYSDERWPTACGSCGAPVPLHPRKPKVVGERGVSLTRQVLQTRLYGNASGSPEPGDVYILPYHNPGECPFWDDCDGDHLWAMLPNGDTWDIDSRAANCTLKDERTHRCWVKEGSAEAGTLSVGKQGFTCAAGAGSIATPTWHGFLRNFEWVQ